MDTSKLLTDLKAEMDRLSVFYTALKKFEAGSKPVPALEPKTPAYFSVFRKPKGKLSAAGLASIRAAQRKRRAREAAAKKAKVTNGK